MDLTYFIVAEDQVASMWLVVAISVGGPACVVSRWTTKEAADKDAHEWWNLENRVTQP